MRAFGIQATWRPAYDWSMGDNPKSIKRKATVAPILQANWDVVIDHPIDLLPRRSLTIENVSSLLAEKHFALWKENLSENQIKQVSQARIGVVHRFESAAHIGKDEQESKDFVERAIACLHIIRPARGRVQTIQLQILDDADVDVFRFTHPEETQPNIPQSDVLNTIRTQDFSTLQSVLPKFLSLWDGGPHHIFRAVRYFLTGYSGIHEPIAQVLIWVAGIEAVLSKGEPLGPSETVHELFTSINGDWNIYEDSALCEFTKVDVQLRQIGEDIFKLRNLFAHGGWIPEEWVGKTGRPSTTGTVEYAEMLREASAAILRKLLMNWLTNKAASTQVA